LKWQLHPRDKPGLLWGVLNQVDGLNAHLALEGYLGVTTLLNRPDADLNETALLKRQGYAIPPTDFVVFPVSPGLVKQLKMEINARGRFGERAFSNDYWLDHAQLEVEGTLLFGGYDGFHRECVYAWSPLTETFLQGLVRNGVLVSYWVLT
jgi:hypothetical protein